MCKQKGWQVEEEELKKLKKTCQVCQWFNMPRRKKLYDEVCEATYPGQSLSMDVIEPLPEGELG